MAEEITSSPEGGGNPIQVGSTSGPQCLRLPLRADLAEVGRVRALVDEIQPLCGLSDERAFDVKVTLSEACANAIEHAGSAVLLVAWLLTDRILFEISNDGGFLPGLQKDTGSRRRGLGLPLMVSLADQVHVSRLETGITRVSLTFFLSPTGTDLPRSLADFVPRLPGKQELGPGLAQMATWSLHQEVFAVLETVAAAPGLEDASLALLSGALRFTGCEGGMLRVREDLGAKEGWLPALVHSGLREEFLREEALIRLDECMCGRVCMGLTDPSLPFFTARGTLSLGPSADDRRRSSRPRPWERSEAGASPRGSSRSASSPSLERRSRSGCSI